MDYEGKAVYYLYNYERKEYDVKIKKNENHKTWLRLYFDKTNSCKLVGRVFSIFFLA